MNRVISLSMLAALACCLMLPPAGADEPDTETTPPSAESAVQQPEASPAEQAGEKPARPDGTGLFRKLDTNSDGKVTTDEVKGPGRGKFDRAVESSDKDKDGALTLEEFRDGFAAQRQGRGGPGRGGPGRGEGRPSPEKLMARLDANSDGQIKLDEIPAESRQRFERMITRADKDKSGGVSSDELKEHFKNMAERMRQGGVGGRGPDGERMFKQFDANADGKLTANEVPQEGRERFQRMLARNDKDKDGAVSKEEFQAQVRERIERARAGGGPAGKRGPRAGHSKPGEGAKRGNMMRLDADKDGKITAEEFSAPAKKRFAKFDSNSDGFLDPEEIKQIQATWHKRGHGARPHRPRGAAPAGPAEQEKS